LWRYIIDVVMQRHCLCDASSSLFVKTGKGNKWGKWLNIQMHITLLFKAWKTGQIAKG